MHEKPMLVLIIVGMAALGVFAFIGANMQYTGVVPLETRYCDCYRENFVNGAPSMSWVMEIRVKTAEQQKYCQQRCEYYIPLIPESIVHGIPRI